MTLIAYTMNQKMPFIISDLLWSGAVKNPLQKLPTTGLHLHEPVEDAEGNKPAILRQKMYFLGETTCIVFAGDSPEISVFLAVMRNMFKGRRHVSMAEITQFLNGYKLEKHFAKSAFFITQFEREPGSAVNVSQFYYPPTPNILDPARLETIDGAWNILEGTLYEKVMALGSGAEGFMEVINDPVTYYSGHDKGDFMCAAQANSILIAKLLALERVTLYTVKDFWGGGFELGYYNGQRFEKLDRIAYIICHGRFDEKGDIGLPIPMLTMHYQYISGILCITAVEARKFIITESDGFVIFYAGHGDFTFEHFSIESEDSSVTDVPPLPSDRSFICDKIAVAYSLLTSNNRIESPAFFNLGSEVQVSYKDGESLEIRIDKKITENVRGLCRQYMTGEKPDPDSVIFESNSYSTFNDEDKK